MFHKQCTSNLTGFNNEQQMNKLQNLKSWGWSVVDLWTFILKSQVYCSLSLISS